VERSDDYSLERADAVTADEKKGAGPPIKRVVKN